MTETAIFSYGSLIHPAELERQFPDSHADAFPVKLDGFRRSFGQRADFRVGKNGELGVMTLEEDEEAWVNGVVVPSVGDERLAEYRDRESGYEIREVSGDRVEPYEDGDEFDDSGQLLLAVGDLANDDPEPIPSYAALVTNGATLWGDEFLADFLVTTHRV